MENKSIPFGICIFGVSTRQPGSLTLDPHALSCPFLVETLPVLEELRQAVAAAEFALRGRFRPRKKPVNPRNKKAAAGKLRVTVSIGAAERGGVLKEAAQVMKAADQALYRAKKAGRNQVCS